MSSHGVLHLDLIAIIRHSFRKQSPTTINHASLSQASSFPPGKVPSLFFLLSKHFPISVINIKRSSLNNTLWKINIPSVK